MVDAGNVSIVVDVSELEVIQGMGYSYNPGLAASDISLISRIRMEIGDTNVGNGGVDAIFSDQELMWIYNQEGGDFNLGIARLYEVLAANSALYIGKQSFINNFTDGSAISIELVKMAESRRSQYSEVI